MNNRFIKQIASTLIVALALVHPAQADRVKDLASVAAVRSNQLVGYGIVVGLQGSELSAQ